MFDLALTRAEWNAYLAAIRSGPRIRLEIRIRNRNEEPIAALTAPANRVISGAVQMDARGAVSRLLDLTVLDERGRIRFEGNSPAKAALYADRFISVRHEVWVPDVIEDWVSCPVFWGPITGFERRDGQVAIEAQGKESLMQAPHYATNGYTLGKRMRLDDAIRRVGARAGESRFALPDLPERLHHARPVGARSEPWKVLAGGEVDAKGDRVRGLVEKAPGNRRPYYNGRGQLTVRRVNRQPAFTFREGRDLIGAEPNILYDFQEFRNCVVVRGGKPKGKPPAHGRAMLQAGHPLSPQSLGRNGQPRFLTEFIDAEGLKKDEECERRAHEVLDRLSSAGVNPEFECLPYPFLEEDDRVRLDTSEGALSFGLRRFTLPLTTGPMLIGSNRKTQRFRRRG